MKTRQINNHLEIYFESIDFTCANWKDLQVWLIENGGEYVGRNRGWIYSGDIKEFNKQKEIFIDEPIKKLYSERHKNGRIKNNN